MASQMNNEPGYMGGRLFACNVNIQALDHHVPVVLLMRKGKFRLSWGATSRISGIGHHRD